MDEINHHLQEVLKELDEMKKERDAEKIKRMRVEEGLEKIKMGNKSIPRDEEQEMSKMNDLIKKQLEAETSKVESKHDLRVSTENELDLMKKQLEAETSKVQSIVNKMQIIKVFKLLGFST